MHLDKYHLPVQADGDPMDQLQRVGMIGTAEALSGKDNRMRDVPVEWGLDIALSTTTQGSYRRHYKGDPRDVSADQLIPVIAYYIAKGGRFCLDAATEMFIQMMKRLGFAQNTRDGLNGDYSKWKIPDFMFFRAMPLFCRVDIVFWLFAWVFDLYLIVMAIGAVLYGRRSPDNVDDNNTVVTLAVCRLRRPTLWSWLASWIYGKWRPWNYGCAGFKDTSVFGLAPTRSISARAYGPIYGALRWYHRAESGGNPEIAEIWKPIIERLWGKQ